LVPRVTIWSIVEEHHLLFAMGFIILWSFGIAVLVKHSLCETGFWPVSLVVVQGIGPVTLFAVSLPFALLKGAETAVTLYEAARARRAERERRAREEEREAFEEALRAFIESKGEYLTPKDMIEFLNQLQEETTGASRGAATGTRGQPSSSSAT
jgi:hypothetical protein